MHTGRNNKIEKELGIFTKKYGVKRRISPTPTVLSGVQHKKGPLKAGASSINSMCQRLVYTGLLRLTPFFRRQRQPTSSAALTDCGVITYFGRKAESMLWSTEPIAAEHQQE